MKAMIIEEEELAADALADLIKGGRPETKILHAIGSVQETLKRLELNQEPDLMFCDIQLSEGNSFKVFRKADVKCSIIFITAYNQYAIDALKVNSIDSLLKPFIKEEVAQALVKQESLQSRSIATRYGNLQGSAQQSLPKQPGGRTKFLVRQGQTMGTVPMEEVGCFQAEEGVVLLFTSGGKRFIVNNTLD